MEPLTSTSNVTAIKKFFESGVHGRQVTMQEMKALTAEERDELGTLCRAALQGVA